MAETYDKMLENIPADPILARDYPELLALWKEQVEIDKRGAQQSRDEFRMWDNKVRDLLSGSELAYFLEPHITDADLDNMSMVRAGRLDHLTKILWYRQGIKAEGGFNG